MRPRSSVGLRELDLHVDFGFVAVELLRLGQRDLRRRVGDLVDDLLHGVELELAGLGVEPRPQRLALVTLARGRLERVLHGADDDFRLDALFLRDGVDLLQQRIDCSHVYFSFRLPVDHCQLSPVCGCSWRAAADSEFHLQLPALDPRERHAVRPSAFFEQHRRRPRPRRSGPRTPTGRSTGSRRHDLRQPAREPPVVRFVPQRPIEPRRRHFERVVLRRAPPRRARLPRRRAARSGPG